MTFLSGQVTTCVFDIPDEALQGPVQEMGEMVRTAATTHPKPRVVIEVLGGHEPTLVLVSLEVADPADASAREGLPATQRCWGAFAPNIEVCDDLRARGIPAIESRVTRDASGTVFIDCPFYRTETGDSQAAWGRFLTLENLYPASIPRSAGAALAVTYQQQLQSPDPGFSIEKVCVATRTWTTRRQGHDVTSRQVHARAAPAPSRFPDFGRLVHGAKSRLLWSGSIDTAQGIAPHTKEGPVRTAPREDVFGPASFRFREVQIIGFRIDLPADNARIDKHLASLIRPLNFHREAPRDGGPPRTLLPDFEYCVATRSIVIELVRYGRMMSDRPTGALRPSDFMCQHELLVRLLVGRLDDGESQGRDPAVHAPVLFVDNPWSKAVGMQLQGYPKALASFCTGHASALQPLSMDGRAARNDAPVPLHQVSRVCRLHDVAEAGLGRPLSKDARQSLEQSTLVEIRCPQDLDDSPQAFTPINLGWLGTTPALWGTPWRQSDFDPDYRRSFARQTLSTRFTEFSSIQVTPVTDANPLPKAWVQGRFNLINPRFASAPGMTRLAFPKPDKQPGETASVDPWTTLLQLLEEADLLAEDRSLSVLAGDWYRVRCDIDLQIDDGLSW